MADTADDVGEATRHAVDDHGEHELKDEHDARAAGASAAGSDLAIAGATGHRYMHFLRLRHLTGSTPERSTARAAAEVDTPITAAALKRLDRALRPATLPAPPPAVGPREKKASEQ
jgi:hypothetical protein